MKIMQPVTRKMLFKPMQARSLNAVALLGQQPVAATDHDDIFKGLGVKGKI